MLILLCADMQKFPLRMKDNDLLVTELYKDPSGNRITALSVYITQKASQFVCMIFYLLIGNFGFYCKIYTRVVNISCHISQYCFTVMLMQIFVLQKISC